MGIVTVVVIIVVAALIVGFNSSASSSVKQIVMPPVSEEDFDGDTMPDGILVEYHVISEGFSAFSGKGRLKVAYEGETCYSKPVNTDDGNERVELRYQDFVVGNGEYTVLVTYGGKQGRESHEVGWVVEDINVTQSLASKVSAQTQGIPFNVTVVMRDRDQRSLEELPSELTIQAQVKNENGYTVFEDEKELENVKSTYQMFNFVKDYPSWVSGNYTTEVTVVNDMVNEDSEYKEVTASTKSYMDAPPVAILNPSTTSISLLSDQEVKLDGSSSYDDGEIVSYSWYLGYDVNNDPVTYSETEEDALDGSFDGVYTHDFSNAPLDDLEVTLTISDKNGNSDFAIVVISKTAL